MSLEKRKSLLLSKVKANQDNPRIISESRLKKLVNSLLVFPKMLSLRPIVVDKDNFVLGGNMRLTALGRIAQMTMEELQQHIETLPEYNELPDGGAEVIAYWEQFLARPTVEVVSAPDLTEEEKKQFIIKDNVSFGDWDWDELQNWDADQLDGWGVETNLPEFSENGGGRLPKELDGVDLVPDSLEKIEGEDRTEKQRVIISFYPKQAQLVRDLLGLDDIEKIVYNIEELVK